MQDWSTNNRKTKWTSLYIRLVTIHRFHILSVMARKSFHVRSIFQPELRQEVKKLLQKIRVLNPDSIGHLYLIFLVPKE